MVCSFVSGNRACAQIIFPESGRGLGHVTPRIFGSTVGYPSDSLASCFTRNKTPLYLRHVLTDRCDTKLGWKTQRLKGSINALFRCFVTGMTPRNATAIFSCPHVADCSNLDLRCRGPIISTQNNVLPLTVNGVYKSQYI